MGLSQKAKRDPEVVLGELLEKCEGEEDRFAEICRQRMTIRGMSLTARSALSYQKILDSKSSESRFFRSSLVNSQRVYALSASA